MSDSKAELSVIFNLPLTLYSPNMTPNTVMSNNDLSTTQCPSESYNSFKRLINLPNAVRSFIGSNDSEYVEPKVIQWVKSLREYFDRE